MAPEAFKYLVSRELTDGPGGRSQDPGTVVEGKYSVADLASKLVVWDQLRKEYFVFESRDDFLAWQEAVPDRERCFHEVICGGLPQRLKFDIDARGSDLDAISDALIDAALRARGGDAHLEDDAAHLEDDASTSSDPVCLLLGEGGATPPVCRTRAEKICAIMALIIEAALDELHFAYYGIEDILPAREDVAVTDSSGGEKFSFHVLILPHYVADHVEAAEFTAQVLKRIPAPLRGVVDAGVNKRRQNFRLADSAKPGTNRFKRATEEIANLMGTARGLSAKDLFVTAPPGARVLPRVYSESAGAPERKAVRLTITDPAVQAALDLARREKITEGHEPSDVRGTLVCFRRTSPTYCRICAETHHRDNSLMLAIAPVDGTHSDAWPGSGTVECSVVEHCRQARGKGKTVGTIVVDARAADTGRPSAARARAAENAQEAARGLSARIATRVADIAAGEHNPHGALASEFECLPEDQKNVYSEPTMRDYELTPTLAVSAQMKLGKTKALRNYIDRYFPESGIAPSVIRFVTFRQTFSASIAKDFPSFSLYSDVAGDLDPAHFPRLIVQVESLHRLKMGSCPEPIDLLVLDEVESILAQFNSGLHKNFGAAFAMFQWMLKTARHVVCMDANISDRTFRVLERMRPSAPARLHWNRFSRAAGDKYNFTADQGAWLSALYDSLRAGNRVVIPTNSLTEARAYEDAIRREFPGKSVMMYSSETAASEKSRHFADVHTHWGALDVLIFTPTCSAGVSFELEHFDVLFGYFCDASCDVETCRQMLGRVRNLRTREHFICLRAVGNCLPTTVEDIRRLVHDKRAGLYRRIEDAALQFEYDDSGEIRFYESDYFHVWMENVRMVNLSRNDFAMRFVDQVADTGATVHSMGAGGTAGAALLLSHRATRSSLQTARCESIAAAEDLGPEEAAAVRDRMVGQQDIELEDRLGYEKFQLREAFNWHGRPVDADFVSKYQGADARRVYRNLLRVTERETMLASIRAMQLQEASAYEYTMDMRSGPMGFVNESRDLLRDKTNYVSRMHHVTLWLLNACGFSCITDRAKVHEALVEARLRSALPLMIKASESVTFELEISGASLPRLAREPDRARFLSGAMRYVNSVLRKMYGIQLRRSPKSSGGNSYYISQSDVGKLFVFSSVPEPDDAGGARPHIPSNLKPAAAAPAVGNFLDDVFFSAEVFPDDDAYAVYAACSDGEN
jgi:hypothetical protein